MSKSISGLLRCVILLSCFVMIQLGCKKDVEFSRDLSKSIKENARSWYNESTKDLNLSLGALNKQLIALQLEPNWDMVSVSNIDGMQVITTPVKTNLNKVFGNQTTFNLVISRGRMGYEGKIVAVKNLSVISKEKPKDLNSEQLYNTAFTNVDLGKELNANLELRVFSLGLKNERIIYYKNDQKIVSLIIDKTLSLNVKDLKNANISGVRKSNDFTAYIPIPPEGCTDWYLVTTEYTPEGIIIYEWWHFLDRVCGDEEFDENGSGGESTEVKNEVNEPCLKNMVNNILLANVENKVSRMIDSLFGNHASIDLIIRDNLPLPLHIDGNAGSIADSTGTGYGGAIIYLNREVLKKSSKEYIAATIMHEALHAYLGHFGIIMDASHEKMAKDYVNTMGDILKGMFSHLSHSDAKSLAWGGLVDTYFYENPPAGLLKPLATDTVNSHHRKGIIGSVCALSGGI